MPAKKLGHKAKGAELVWMHEGFESLRGISRKHGSKQLF